MHRIWVLTPGEQSKFDPLYITVVIWLHFLMQNNHNFLCIEYVCLYLTNSHNSTHHITGFLMQNNHDLLCIEFVCLYLANSKNSTHYITVVFWFQFLMQNNQDLLCIEFTCLDLAKS